MTSKRKLLKNKKGQSVLEFLLLFLVLLILSFTVIAGFNGKIGERWTKLINIISSDNITAHRTDIQLN